MVDAAPSDAELLAAVATQDLRALRALYDRHASWLSIRLSRRCSDPELVADALQDTFLAVWRKPSAFRGQGEVAAWLWGIAVRRLISRLRGRREVDLGGDGVDGNPVPAAEEQVLLGVQYGELGPALARLSPQLRVVIQAVVLDGLTTKEAARLLHMPESTVKTRLSRAKAQLRATLAEGMG
jgi:RNA polymerase sigma-70 factor (ECF subfamily)